MALTFDVRPIANCDVHTTIFVLYLIYSVLIGLIFGVYESSEITVHS